MKSIQKYITAIVLSLGIVLGVSSLQAAWDVPDLPPPQGNVDAPLNTGLNTQSKLGQLLINTDTGNPFAVGLSVFGKAIFNDGIQITDGAGANKVLTSDEDGDATWQTPSADADITKVFWDRNGGIFNSNNISSAELVGARVRFNFSTPMSNSNYIVICNGKGGDAGSSAINAGVPLQAYADTKNTSYFIVAGYHSSGEDTMYVADCVVYE